MSSNARRWLDFLLPDALTVHIDWLRQLVADDRHLLGQLLRGRSSRLLLMRRLYRSHELAVPARLDLGPHQEWLLADRETQRMLAQTLGRDASHAWIRQTVHATAVTALRKELGEDGYRRALAGPGLAVEGLDRAAFDAALRRGRIVDYFIAVGAALLETTTDCADSFCRMRMRFAFSPIIWQVRPRHVRVDAHELSRRLTSIET